MISSSKRATVLKTWALPRLPEAGIEIPCEALADHRLTYLDYEGPISGGRGTVSRWDQGTFAVEVWTDNEILVELAGGQLAGRVDIAAAGRFARTMAVRVDAGDRLNRVCHLAISVVPATTNAPSSKRIVST